MTLPRSDSLSPREFEELCVKLLDRFGSPLPARKSKLPRIASLRTADDRAIFIKETETSLCVAFPGYKAPVGDETGHVYSRLKQSDQVTNWASEGVAIVVTLIQQRLVLDLLADV